MILMNLPLYVLGFDSHLMLELISAHSNHIRGIDHVMAKTIEKFISFRVRFRLVHTIIYCNHTSMELCNRLTNMQTVI